MTGRKRIPPRDLRMLELAREWKSGHRAGEVEALEWTAALLDDLAKLLGRTRPAAMIMILAAQIRCQAEGMMVRVDRPKGRKIAHG